MSSFSFDDTEINKMFDDMANNMPKVRDEALKEMGELVRDEIKKNYKTKLKKSTGNLANTITVGKVKNGEVEVYIKYGKERTSEGNSLNVVKAIALEYGTSKQAPTPIFYPSKDAVEDKAIQIALDKIYKLGE